MALPVALGLAYRTGRLDARTWRLFWIGCAIGASWELALVANHGAARPALVMLTPFPGGPLAHGVLHILWDGGLFLGGLACVFGLSRGPRLARFSAAELGIVIAWGQAQELAVEVSSTLAGAWTYAPGHAWNPVLFTLGDGRITLLPQLVWLAASVLFYFVALRVGRRP